MIEVVITLKPKKGERKESRTLGRAEIYKYTTGIGRRDANFGYKIFTAHAIKKGEFVVEQGAFGLVIADGKETWDIIDAMLAEVNRQRQKANRLKKAKK